VPDYKRRRYNLWRSSTVYTINLLLLSMDCVLQPSKEVPFMLLRLENATDRLILIVTRNKAIKNSVGTREFTCEVISIEPQGLFEKMHKAVLQD